MTPADLDLAGEEPIRHLTSSVLGHTTPASRQNTGVITARSSKQKEDFVFPNNNNQVEELSEDEAIKSSAGGKTSVADTREVTLEFESSRSHLAVNEESLVPSGEPLLPSGFEDANNEQDHTVLTHPLNNTPNPDLQTSDAENGIPSPVDQANASEGNNSLIVISITIVASVVAT